MHYSVKIKMPGKPERIRYQIVLRPKIRDRHWTYITGIKEIRKDGWFTLFSKERISDVPQEKGTSQDVDVKNQVALYPTPVKPGSCKITLSARNLWNSSSRLNRMNGSLDLLPSAEEIEPGPPIKAFGSPRERRKSLNTDDPDGITGVAIYDIWKKKLGKDESAAEFHWKRLRKLAYDGLDAFGSRLNDFEELVKEGDVLIYYLDLEAMMEKQREIDDAFETLEDLTTEFQQVSKAFQNIAQYMPPTLERSSVKARMSASRKRYYIILESLSRKRNLLRLMIPLLQLYKDLGSEIKSWLDVTESRTESFITKYGDHKIILKNGDTIEDVLSEVYTQREIYENFLEAGEKMIDINKDYTLDELREDLDEVVARWDLLVSNLEKCVNRLAIAKKIAEENKKQTEPERIEQKIRSEAQLCNCHTQFQIIRIGEGKYTFGTSKIVRLVRIHGTSIVVRVGGGWEFLYEFLLKADPCRAKQISDNAHKGGLQSLHLAGLNLSNMDKKHSTEDFSLNVQRLSRKDYTPKYRQEGRANRSGSLGSAASSDNTEDGVDDLSDMSLSTSNGSSTPQPRKTKNFVPKTSSSRKSSPNKKLSGSMTNISKVKDSSTPRRVSLIERQAAYAEKRKSQSFNLDR